VLFLLLSGQVYAQQSKPELAPPTGQISGLPFDLLPPGARALGIGGAFTAVADDSTAALANPAGLTNLSAPEVSVYLRYTDADVDFLDPDAYNTALNARVGEDGSRLGKEYSDSSTNISFASFVIPFERVTFSGFYSNQLDFKADQSLTDVYRDDIVRKGVGTPDYQNLDEYTNFNSVKSKVENYGASLAFRFTDQFSGGITLRNSRLDLRSRDSWRVDWWNDLETIMADAYFGPNNSDGFATMEQVRAFLPVVNDIYDYDILIDQSDNDLVLDVGLYFQGEQWSFGLVYHGESSFNFDSAGTQMSDFSCNSGFDELSAFCQSYLQSQDPEAIDRIWPDFAVAENVNVKIPRYLSFGTAWRPADTWLISLDVNFYDYSSLNSPRTSTIGFDLDINDESIRSDFYDPVIRDLSGPLTEEIDDEVTFHLGAEKAFIFDGGSLRNLSLRAGVFTVKDHDGIVATDKDDTVWTVGIGSIWGKSELGAKMFQVDLGASFADDVTNVVLSGIFRF
jgi:long-subunit fatty acid transport protein